MRLLAISMVAMGVSSVLLSLMVSTSLMLPEKQDVRAAIPQWQTWVERY